MLNKKINRPGPAGSPMNCDHIKQHIKLQQTTCSDLHSQYALFSNLAREPRASSLTRYGIVTKEAPSFNFL